LDLEASGEVMCLGIGLVLTPVGGPVHRGVDDAFGLVTEVEQAPDFGEGQADPPSERCVLSVVDRAGCRFGRAGFGGGDSRGGGAVVCGSPFFALCRLARMPRKLWAIMARVMCRYQAW
jgi:hypothetical protein